MGNDECGIELDNVPFIQKGVDVMGEHASLYKMGLGVWRPAWLQKFSSIKWFMLILTFLLLMQGIVVTGLTAVSIPSIEREFHLSRNISSAILIGSDSGALLLVIFVSFYGKNRVKWIATSAFLTGIGSMIFSVPKIMLGKDVYETKINSTFALCNDDMGDLPSNCHKQQDNFKYSLILLIGQMMMGIGHTSLQTLAPVYINENTSSQMAPIYLGIWLASLLVGPVLGRIIGFAFLGTVVNQFRPGMDVIWVHDWWRVYLYSSFIFMLLGVLVLVFPQKLLKGRLEVLQEKNAPAKCRTNIDSLVKCMDECVMMFHQKVFLLPVLAFAMNSIYHKEMSELAEHILTFKYNVVHGKTVFIKTTVIFLAICGATFTGAYITRRDKVKFPGKTAAKTCAVLSFIMIIYSITFNIPDCNEADLINMVFSNNFVTQCKADCDCNEEIYQPVCSIDHTTYFSPCFAGCKEVIKLTNKTVILNGCSCVPTVTNATKPKLFVYAKNEESTIKEITNYASLGKCHNTCQYFYFFIAVFTVGTIFFYMIGIPHYTIILRTVPNNKQPLALGLQFLIVRSLSFVPGPMLFGYLTSSDCMAWSYDRCGVKETCLEYNLNTLGNKMIWLGTSKSDFLSNLQMLDDKTT